MSTTQSRHRNSSHACVIRRRRQKSAESLARYARPHAVEGPHAGLSQTLRSPMPLKLASNRTDCRNRPSCQANDASLHPGSSYILVHTTQPQHITETVHICASCKQSTQCTHSTCMHAYTWLHVTFTPLYPLTRAILRDNRGTEGGGMWRSVSAQNGHSCWSLGTYEGCWRSNRRNSESQKQPDESQMQSFVCFHVENVIDLEVQCSTRSPWRIHMPKLFWMWVCWTSAQIGTVFGRSGRDAIHLIESSATKQQPCSPRQTSGQYSDCRVQS